MVKFIAKNKEISVGNFAETAAFADVIVLSVAGGVVTEAIDLAGKENLANKVVIDATNPIANEAPVNGILIFFTDINHSLMEKI